MRGAAWGAWLLPGLLWLLPGWLCQGGCCQGCCQFVPFARRVWMLHMENGRQFPPPKLPQVLTVPEPPTPLVSLGEDDPLSLAPTYFPAEANGLLSDLGPFDGMAVGLPPRVVDASLLKGMKQVGREGTGRGAGGCCGTDGAGHFQQLALRALAFLHSPLCLQHLHINRGAFPIAPSCPPYPYSRSPILWATSRTRTSSGDASLMSPYFPSVDFLPCSNALQSDFVGYIQNPHVQRGGPYGAATRAAAPQRNARVQPRPDTQELGTHCWHELDEWVVPPGC